LPPHARAEAAVRGGADLVIELPLPFSISSAERFAFGAISLLNALGVVSHLSFGSECTDLDLLFGLSEKLSDPDFYPGMFEGQKAGTSFASARQTAAERALGEGAAILSEPNSILAVEYLKAIRRTGAPITPVAVRRLGAGHHAAGVMEGTASATHIRSLLASSDADSIRPLVPGPSFDIIRREILKGRAPVFMKHAESAILSHLRRLGPADFCALPDATEGLGLRLRRAAYRAASLDELFALAKTKRYPMTRIRRMVLAAYLGVTADMLRTPPPYIQILALNDTGRKLARHIRVKTTLPVITKPADAKKLSGEALRIFGLSVLAADLYALAYPDLKNSAGGSKWTESPVYVKNAVGRATPPEL